MSATVKIISPILVNESWVLSGEIDMLIDEARVYEAAGMVDIVSIDGEAVTWAACCSGTHEH